MKNQKLTEAVRTAFTMPHGKPVATPLKSHAEYFSKEEQKKNLQSFVDLLQKWQNQSAMFEHRLDEMSRIVRNSEEYNANDEERLYFETMIQFLNLMSIRIKRVKIQPVK